MKRAIWAVALLCMFMLGTVGITQYSTKVYREADKLVVQDGGYLKFGTDEDVTLTYDETTNDELLVSGATAFANTVTFRGGQTRRVLFTPTDVELDGASPPGTTSVGTNGQARFDALGFDADGGTTGDDIVFISWVVPDGYVVDSGRLNVYWSFPNAETDGDDVVFDMTVNAVAAGEVMDAAGTAFTEGDTDIAVGASQGKLFVTQLNFEVETIAVGDVVTIKFWVDESASDLNASGVCNVHFFEIEYESTE